VYPNEREEALTFIDLCPKFMEEKEPIVEVDDGRD